MKSLRALIICLGLSGKLFYENARSSSSAKIKLIWFSDQLIVVVRIKMMGFTETKNRRRVY